MRIILRFFAVAIVAVMIAGCGLFQKVVYVPVESKTDSVYVETIVERLDTLKIEIPGENVYVVKQDSSHIETSVAFSDAVIDSAGLLHHSLTNKKGALEKQVVYKDKIIEKEITVEKEVPVEVEVPVKYVPTYYKWINGIFWGLIALFVIFIALKIYFRF